MTTSFDPRAISDPEQVRILGSPIRQELVDTLAARGGAASIATLAEELGRAADGLYHHMRKLMGAGLIYDATPSGSKERIYRLAGGGDAPLRLAYRLGPDGNAAELEVFASNLTKVACRDFTEATKSQDVAVDGPQRELWISRNKGWISDDDLQEINALLERLSVLASQPKQSERNRLISLAFLLAPHRSQSKRRGEG